MLCDDFQHLLTNPWLFTCWRATGSSNIVDGFRLYLVSLSTNTHSVGSLITLKHYRKNRHLPDYLLSLCALSRACLLPGTGSEEPPLYAQWSLSRHCSTLCIMIQSLQHQMALSLLVRPRLCRCTVLGALLQSSGQSVGLIPASVLPRAHLFQTSSPSSVSAQQLLTILSMSCTCGTSTVFFRVLKLVLIAVVGNVDQIVLFLFVVATSSEVRLVLASHVLHDGMRDLVLHCLAAKLLIWTLFAAEASGCFCRELIVALDLPCSHSRCGSALFTLVLVKLPGLLVVFDCLSRRARRSRWRTVRLLRVVFWSSTALVRVQIVSSSGKRLEHDIDRASRSLLRRPGRLPPKLSVAPSPRWPCNSRHRYARLVDRSACLMEFCTCDRHTKCSRTSRSAHSCPREPHRFRPVSQSLHLFVSGLRDLGLLLDDRLGSAPPPLCS